LSCNKIICKNHCFIYRITYEIMKKNYAIYFYTKLCLLICFCSLNIFTVAQTSSAHRKSSNAYRNNYQRVAAGSNSLSTFEIRDNGTLWAWGKNDKGQLGDNTIISKTSPVQIGVDENWVSITTGWDYTIGLKADGTLWAWGDNEYGQLGDGTYTNKITPTQIGASNNWVSVATGGNVIIALKSNGTMWAWGSRKASNNLEGNNFPTQVGINNDWASISVGFTVPVAIKSNGTLWILSGSTDAMLATQKGTDNDWVKASNSGYHTIAIKSNGTIWAWGINNYGQTGSTNTDFLEIPTQIGTEDKWVSTVVGDAHTIGLKCDGTLWAWGDNRNGQLGDGTLISKNAPTQVGTKNNWVSITAGAHCTFGVQCDGTLWAWGENNEGQLGDGTTEDKSIPTKVSYTSSGVLSAALGLYFSTATKTDGTLWTWGSTPYSELNDGFGSVKHNPTKIGVDNSWVSIIAGQDFSAAIKCDGTLWTWGSNVYGQLGNGTFDFRSIPVKIGLDNSWVSIDTGDDNLFAIKSNGTLWSCGSNGFSILGYTTPSGNHANTLNQVGLDNKWVSVSVGNDHCVGLKSDGTIWGWGRNYEGQLGDGTTQNVRDSPIQIGNQRDWISIKAGNYYTLAIKANGTLWAWGDNSNFRLGDKTQIAKKLPTQIGGDNNWVCIQPEVYNTKAIKSDGTLWAWGTISSYREWGDGTNAPKIEPTRINNLNNIISLIKVMLYQNVAIIRTNRNSLCLMGDNSFGQLGDGTTIDRNIFDCISFGQTTVPLHLTNYTVKLNHKNVINTWQTANEINVNHINVQRSFNGVDFNTIGTVTAKGGGNYSFTDATLPANANTLYYRLLTVDNDGSSPPSNVLAVKLNINTAGTLSIFPNPVTGNQFTVILNNLPKGTYQLKLNNILGIIVNKINFVYDGTTLSKTIDADLPAGVYYLSIITQGYSETQKLVVY
jgi:alpha-tubulin suppressor-like RCC1 family protein